MLSNLIEKEKGYLNAENTSDDESHNEESSSDIKNQEEQVEEEVQEEVASENGVQDDSQESENDTETNLVPRVLSYPSLRSEREGDPDWVWSRGPRTK